MNQGYEPTDITYDEASSFTVDLDTTTRETRQDADAANINTLAAYTLLLVFLMLLAVSPAIVIATWKALL